VTSAVLSSAIKHALCNSLTHCKNLLQQPGQLILQDAFTAWEKAPSTHLFKSHPVCGGGEYKIPTLLLEM
jgi:hypothetical protein